MMVQSHPGILKETMMEEQDLWWLAGYLEGEGSFTSGPPSAPNQPRIQMTTTDKDIADRVGSLLGIKPQPSRLDKRNPKWKRAYIVIKRGKAAVVLMRELYPMMGNRRQGQIDKAISSHRSHVARTRAGLSETDVLIIFRRAHAGEQRALIAQDFGITTASVSHIKTGRYWSWLTQPEVGGL
jgi:hypothetical protein